MGAATTGHAVADVLFGDVNPAGRLTQTWYRVLTGDLRVSTFSIT